MSDPGPRLARWRLIERLVELAALDCANAKTCYYLQDDLGLQSTHSTHVLFVATTNGGLTWHSSPLLMPSGPQPTFAFTRA